MPITFDTAENVVNHQKVDHRRDVVQDEKATRWLATRGEILGRTGKNEDIGFF
jgi:hypothetical protein